MKIDRSNRSVNRLIREKFHIYKSIGDYDSAKLFYDHYSEVDEEMLKIRKIVIDL